MNTFIVIAASITLLTLIALILPLVRNRNVISYERRAQNIHFAKERLAELEQQLKNAAISAADYEALKLEIENTLAEDIDIAEQSEQVLIPNNSKSNFLLIGLLCLSIPIAVALVYLNTGKPEAIAIQQQAAQAPSAQEIEQLISGIEARLEAKPDDARGWRILSRTYLALGRNRQARDAYLKLIELEGESPETLVSLAQASAALVGGELAGQPLDYVQRALKLDPANPQALWLLGLNASQQGQNNDAVKVWSELLPLLAAAPQQQQELRNIIAETQAKTDTPINGIQSTSSSNTQSKDLNSSIINLKVGVSISAQALESSQPDDLVFVFARAQNGPAAPLAVKRIFVKDLPTIVSLSDNDAMLPQFKLSLFEDVIITARLSKSGNPIAQTGDFQSSEVATQNSTTETINLEIANVVK